MPTENLRAVSMDCMAFLKPNQKNQITDKKCISVEQTRHNVIDTANVKCITGELLTPVSIVHKMSLTSVVGQSCFPQNQQSHQVYNRFFQENPTK